MTDKSKKNKKVSSKKMVFDKIRETQERLIVSLAAAWETAPDDPEIRKQLMEAMEKAIDLREKVYKQILKEEPPDIAQSREKLRSKLERKIKSRK